MVQIPADLLQTLPLNRSKFPGLLRHPLVMWPGFLFLSPHPDDQLPGRDPSTPGFLTLPKLNGTPRMDERFSMRSRFVISNGRTLELNLVSFVELES